MSASSTTAVTGKIAARTASIHIDPACNAFLHDCFRTYGIHIVSLAGDPVVQLQRQKFEACLLRLYDPEAEKILEAARPPSSNPPLVHLRHRAKHKRSFPLLELRYQRRTGRAPGPAKRDESDSLYSTLGHQ